jgi:hypothetical protein
VAKQTLAPDPGGIFETDAQRHVLGHLRPPTDDGHGDDGIPAHDAGMPTPLDQLDRRLALDATLDGVDKGKVLAELEEQGYAIVNDGAATMTDEGFAAMLAPHPDAPPKMSREQIEAMHEAGELTDEQVTAWEEAPE